MTDANLLRDVELDHLHPAFRQKVMDLLAALQQEGLPFRLFEGYRSPQRQAVLYTKGRTDKVSPKVTNAKPWSSYHQYGTAADLILFENSKWSWDTKGPKSEWWERMHRFARAQGLESLSFEKPHVQLMGQRLKYFLLGHYPEGGDVSWQENLNQNILSWRAAGGQSGPPTVISL